MLQSDAAIKGLWADFCEQLWNYNLLQDSAVPKSSGFNSGHGIGNGNIGHRIAVFEGSYHTTQLPLGEKGKVSCFSKTTWSYVIFEQKTISTLLLHQHDILHIMPHKENSFPPKKKSSTVSPELLLESDSKPEFVPCATYLSHLSPMELQHRVPSNFHSLMVKGSITPRWIRTPKSPLPVRSHDPATSVPSRSLPEDVMFFFEQKSWLERVDTLKSQSAAKESFETKNIILNVSIIISVKLNTWKLNNRFFEFAVCTNQCLVSTLLNFLRISSSQCRWLEFFLVAQTD